MTSTWEGVLPSYREVAVRSINDERRDGSWTVGRPVRGSEGLGRDDGATF